MKPAIAVMAGLVPAIGRGTLPLRMAGTSPAMTVKVMPEANRVSRLTEATEGLVSGSDG